MNWTTKKWIGPAGEHLAASILLEHGFEIYWPRAATAENDFLAVNEKGTILKVEVKATATRSIKSLRAFATSRASTVRDRRLAERRPHLLFVVQLMTQAFEIYDLRRSCFVDMSLLQQETEKEFAGV
jgi:hypothetical protein